MVYYRKYRPQKIEELDSKDLRERLYPVLSSSVAHAFLFTGPKGLGKTSTARIVAKAVNCEKRFAINKEQKTKNKEQKGKILGSELKVKSVEDIEPCNECAQCISITNGSSLDVLEIDGASNRGIEEIRDLREKIKLLPVSAKKKVYIIDEVHMLTTDAFNALLKTLEEPPVHAMFIFCTTEAHKVPGTIVSRCFHVQFHIATDEELISSFHRIGKGEKLSIDEEVFGEVAKLSDGSFREGAKILEELVLGSGGEKITKELLEEKYQVASIKYYVENIVSHLKNKDTKFALSTVEDVIEKGTDIKYFLEQLISKLHVDLLMQVGVETETRNKKQEMSIEDIKRLVELFSKAHQELRYAVLPQLPLELAIIEWGIEKNNQLSVLSSQLSDNSQSVNQLTGKPKTDNRIWGQLIDKVKTHNHSLAGVLRGCSLKSFSDSELVIETSFQFHKEKLSEEKAVRVLEQVASEITGNPVKVLIELKGK
ncbi:MAG: DNA polymerase III, subunit gamma and tau [Candidatus Levybacteria bacterium RIFCSPLOWO2_12_FULL_37_7]|nr:MAG: DNA polymerase III, subunit gamma and tau [Candidatus Levybacteria bacterium RIFCSPLOWO2_12_FULL_37_7]